MRAGPLAAAIFSCLAAALLTAAPAAAQTSAEPTWVTLGTGGGPLIRVERALSSNALISGGDVILFDAGDGVIHGLAAAHIRIEQVKAVVISHLHPDHTSGLAALIALRWQMDVRAPLTVFGPPGTKALVDGILASNKPAERIGYAAPGVTWPSAAKSVSITETACRGEALRIGGWTVTAVGNTHYVLPGGAEPVGERSCSFRIEQGTHSVFYTGDTGPDPALVKPATGADLLVSEVIDLKATLAAVDAATGGRMPAAQRQGLEYHLSHHHLAPEEIGKMATAAHVAAVVLTHVAPGLDGETSAAGYVDGVKRFFGGPVTLAHDGERFPSR